MTIKRNFILSAISPLLPIVAVLIFNSINQALPLLIVSILVACFIIWTTAGLLRRKERAKAYKLSGTLLATIGLLITLIVIIMAGMTVPKV